MIIITGALVLSNVSHEPEKIKIGIMTPLSGDLAFLGQNIVRSAELAIQELGYQDKVKLIIEDAGQLDKESIAAYKKLVEIDHVQIIIDGMTSDGTMSIAPLIDQDKIVMITPLTGGENIDNAAEYLFRNGPSDVLAGTKPAKEIFERGLNNVALITDNAEYTLDISKHFRKEFKGTLVYDEKIAFDTKDFRAEISKFQSKNPQAIVINTATGNSAAYIIKQLYESENKKPIFANFIAFNANTLEIAGESAFEGVYIYDPEFNEDSKLTKDFFMKYKEKYGNNPPIPFHTTGTYDAIKMSLEAINKGEDIHNYLLNEIQNWEGMNGKISFDEKGNTKTSFVLKQVKEGKLVRVN